MAINIVGFLITQEPIASWTPTQKQEMLDLFCKARGYRETTAGADGEIIPNPQTKAQFLSADLIRYLFSMVNNEKLKQARESVTIVELIAV